MAELNLQDNSGDRDFFTIAPNLVLNHSTANDQALYYQMKRYAGEDGKCFATEKTLMRKLGIGKKAYDKSLAYLLEKGWITYIGMTGGKTRPIKTYSINNIWKLNSEYYKKISAESTLFPKNEKDKSQKEKDKSQKQYKISAESNVEEEPVLSKNQEEEPVLAEQSSASTKLNDFLYMFKEVNPSYKQLFKNTTQRGALERMLAEHGEEKVRWLLEALPKVAGQRYAPTITTPLQLENKLGDLLVFIKKESGNKSQIAEL